MGVRLVNVRLDEARARKVRRLRAAGVTLSDLVRDAIDARFDAVTGPESLRNPDAVLDQILEHNPDPAGAPRRSYDVHDRSAARTAIVAKMRRRPT